MFSQDGLIYEASKSQIVSYTLGTGPFQAAHNYLKFLFLRI